MVSAIVLAAGLSSRMGNENKLLLSCGGKTIIQHVVDNLIAGHLDEIIVITGHESLLVEKALESEPVKLIYNLSYADGMTTSIQQGVRNATRNGYMICLGDMVMIKPEEYALLKQAFEVQLKQNPGCICVPRFDDKKGNPVIFSSSYKDEILQHKDMQGCSAIVQSNQKNIHWVDMSTDNILQDVDYYSDYQYLHHFFIKE